VYQEHLILRYWKIICTYGLSKKEFNLRMIVRTYQSKKILIFQFWVR